MKCSPYELPSGELIPVTFIANLNWRKVVNKVKANVQILTEAMIMSLLDSDMPKKQKDFTRNLMVPCCELIEDAETPGEMLNKIEFILRCVVPILTIGIHGCCRDDKKLEMEGILSKRIFEMFGEYRLMLANAERVIRERMKNEAN